MIHRWEDAKRKRLSAAQIAEVEAAAERDVLELDLRALRDAAQMTQAQMAPLIEMSQSELSRLERRSDLQLSTLARYVRALGGHVKIVAEVGKKKITLAEG